MSGLISLHKALDRDRENAHTDHPLRHYDRTCLACNEEAIDNIDRTEREHLSMTALDQARRRVRREEMEMAEIEFTAREHKAAACMAIGFIAFTFALTLWSLITVCQWMFE